MATTPQIEALASNVTWNCDIWKMTARDGTVAAYAAHSRPLTFNSVLYDSSPVEVSRLNAKIGLDPNSADLMGIFDSIVTEPDLDGGRWKRARIVKEVLVDYRDLSLGSVDKQVGFAGKFQKSTGRFTVEFQSLSSLLSQLIGDLTSPTDRRRRLDELGINVTSFTHARAVSAVVDRRNFTVNGSAQVDGYFKNGLVKFTSGANNNLEMEIKNNVGNTIELQLPMRSTIVNADTVTLYRGYAGTRDDAKAIGAILAAQFEPDLPGLNQLIAYPE